MDVSSRESWSVCPSVPSVSSARPHHSASAPPSRSENKPSLVKRLLPPSLLFFLASASPPACLPPSLPPLLSPNPPIVTYAISFQNSTSLRRRLRVEGLLQLDAQLLPHRLEFLEVLLVLGLVFDFGLDPCSFVRVRFRKEDDGVVSSETLCSLDFFVRGVETKGRRGGSSFFL